MASNIEEYNKDELDAPDWLNAEFFAKVLRESENDAAIEVQQFRITPATIMGDHYASVMFRAAVEYQQKGASETKSLIIKTMPEVEGHKKEMIGDSHIFETEIGMYTEVLPRFERILRAVGDDTALTAPCLYHSLNPNKLMVFEDIVPLGYKVLRDRPATVEEVKCVLLKMAKWHAIEMAVEPAYFQQYCHGLLTVPALRDNDTICGGMRLFIEMLYTVPELKEYIPYFEALDDDLFAKCVASYTEYHENAQDNAFYVLVHGDLHLRNMMFKHNGETGKLEDVMLLDFQLSYVGPIVNDFIYSIYMIMESELRKNHLDELMHYYFTNFRDTLKKIGYEGQLVNLLQFRQQIMVHKHFEIFLLVTFLPMLYSVRSGKCDPEQLMTSVDMRKSLYQKQEYIDELKLILPKYLHLGYLEK